MSVHDSIQIQGGWCGLLNNRRNILGQILKEEYSVEVTKDFVDDGSGLIQCVMCLIDLSLRMQLRGILTPQMLLLDDISVVQLRN